MTSERAWKERWARLKSMTADELLDRTRQQVGARIDACRYRMGLEVPVDIRRSQSRPQFFFALEDVNRICDLLKRRLPQQADDIVHRADRICEHRFDVLGYENVDYGSDIDWHCDRVHGKQAPRKPFHQLRYLDFDEAGDVKITWELNRHQHFVTLAKAYRLSGNQKFTAELLRQWKDWHECNPYPVGINWASSLEVAFRSISWIWSYFLLADCPETPEAFRSEWLHALAISGRHIERYLSTYFSPNTHLLGEAVGLFFIGTLCPELTSASDWQKRGWQIILHEAKRQVHADGWHFEQSTYYHVYALDFFLHARILASLNDIAIPAEFDLTIEKMLHALGLLSRAGAPPNFGDDDGGRVFDPRRNRSEHMLDPLATGAVLFGRSDFKHLSSGLREETLWLLGETGIVEFDRLPLSKPRGDSTSLKNAGLFLMTSPESSQQLVIDAGPQGAMTAGHGHADALSVCLNSRGRPLLIDPGTCEYVGDAGHRNHFRATAAHNTLQLDNRDQADTKGPFGWANLPRVKMERWITSDSFDYFQGSHNGYERLAAPVVHRRCVFFLKPSFWFFRDIAQGEGQHSLDLFWHIAPGLKPNSASDLAFVAGHNEPDLLFVLVDGHDWSQEAAERCWSPVYGRTEPAPVLKFSAQASLPAEFVILLLGSPHTASQPGQLTSVETDAGLATAYQYRTADEVHRIIFCDGSKAWSVGAYSSDAELLYVGTRAGRQRQLIFCNGSYVDFSGTRIISCERLVERCEVSAEATGTQIATASPSLVTIHESLEKIVAEVESVIASKIPTSKI
jgi:hypothetical protein